MENCEKKPVIIQTGYYYPSRTVLVDSRVPLNITYVSERMDLEKGKWVITLKSFLNKGEVISIGKLNLKYRIIREKGFSKTLNLPKYEIRKICGNLFSTVDEDNAKVGAKVKIINRKTEAKVLAIANNL